jgi:hypothetical protein
MTVDELNDVLTFYFDWMIRNLLVPGRIESWLVILDLNGVGFSNIPMGRLKVFIKTIQNNFPGRLFRLIVVNANWYMRSFWALLNPFFDDYTRQKMIMSGDVDSAHYKREVL